MREGTFIFNSNHSTEIHASPRMNVAYNRINDTLLSTYGSKAGIILMKTPYRAVKVIGPGVTEWHYSNDSAQVSITLDSASTVTIQLTKDPTSVVELRESTLPRISAVYPNPLSHGKLHVEYSGHRGIGEIRLVNTLGKVCATVGITDFDESTIISTKNIPTGMYQVQLLENGTVVSMRNVVIIQ
ncbi:MAG: T9SS type A sorting domain-containing protein [Ignavibacteria bacterium]|nr:T9SS type A sorting domain-containing protein [Ignavibacteria bacterium]